MSFANRIRTAYARWHALRVETRFGTARIYATDWNGRRMRVLDMDGTFQSGTYLDEHWCDVPFPYLSRFDAIFSTDRPMRDLCMLGGGGYAYPRHLIAHHDPVRVDVVEIDDAITRIACEHFFLDRLQQEYHTQRTGRLNLVCDDAICHLQRCADAGRTYDAILNDCFMGAEAEERLLLPASVEAIHACLRPHGLYVANVISALEGVHAAPLMRHVDALSNAFAHVCVLPSNRVGTGEPDNVLVVASNTPCELAEALPLYDAV
ncbi:MAG: fused MFS/spermidine synthase [Coriobacteriales bacterium]|nr:fused MFS/spermidine synthase [Coriobacteriales bacterium]